jgi:transposase
MPRPLNPQPDQSEDLSLYAILTEAGIEVIVANPVHIKQMPKRKTDRKDAKWLCILLLHGLVRKLKAKGYFLYK